MAQYAQQQHLRSYLQSLDIPPTPFNFVKHLVVLLQQLYQISKCKVVSNYQVSPYTKVDSLYTKVAPHLVFVRCVSKYWPGASVTVVNLVGLRNATNTVPLSNYMFVFHNKILFHVSTTELLCFQFLTL